MENPPKCPLGDGIPPITKALSIACFEYLPSV